MVTTLSAHFWTVFTLLLIAGTVLTAIVTFAAETFIDRHLHVRGHRGTGALRPFGPVVVDRVPGPPRQVRQAVPFGPMGAGHQPPAGSPHTAGQ